MSENTSADALDRLDAQQRAAAVELRGPVAILAGAGAGKTRTITHRIAHGVQTGVYTAERMMALSFTRKAAAELQTRLHDMGVRGVQTRTFHGAALAQMGYFWSQTVGGESPKIVPTKIALLSQAADRMGIRVDQDTLRDVAAEVEWRKVSMLELDEYEDVVVQRGPIGQLSPTDVCELQQVYETLKEERRQIDFEDVLLMMTGMLIEEPRVALQVRERYRFFTVDEYQDISPLQHALLKTWLGDRSDLCVVGDASQTIYSFAGASSRYLLDFSREFDNAQEFRLENNYRSSPEIIEVANRLMQPHQGALQLRPTRPATAQPPVYEWFSDERSEAAAIAQLILTKISEGTSAANIAVLFRAHGYSLYLEEALQTAGVSVRVQGAERYFDRADVRRAVMEIRGQSVIPDGRPLFQVVSDVIRGHGWTSKPPASQDGKDRWDALGALLRLVDEVPAGTSVREFSDELMRRSKSHHEPTLDAVTLSTVHSAKGLEWSVVFLAGIAEGVLPISFAEEAESIDEERRLFYVGLTRAQDELWISGAGRGRRTPSRFLVEAGVLHASQSVSQ